MADLAAVSKVLARGDVTIHNWSAAERNKFRSIAMTEWEKFSHKSPNAKKVYDLLTKYLADNGMLN